MKLTNIIKSSLVLAMGTACVDIQGPEMEPLKPNDILAEIKISSTAIMIAKGDSHQIDYKLIAMNDETIPVDLNKIKWVSVESQVVSVSNTGMLRGLDVSEGPIQVAVEYEHKYVTKFDTVSVYVTNERIDANSIKLIALDSTRIGAFPIIGGPRVRVDLYKDGALVEKGALIPIQVDMPAVAAPDGTGGPTGEPVYRIKNDKTIIGKFWVRSSLNLYGNEVNDSLSFTGLHTSFVTPLIGVMTVQPEFEPPIPLLDTIPLKFYQVCAVQMILNLSMDVVDIVFSDSTAPSNDCAPTGDSILREFGLGVHGEFIGGNVLNMPPFSTALRKSRTQGVIVFKARKSSTKELLPWFTGHTKQIDVQD